MYLQSNCVTPIQRWPPQEAYIRKNAYLSPPTKVTKSGHL
jgi:hypothetical protein